MKTFKFLLFFLTVVLVSLFSTAQESAILKANQKVKDYQYKAAQDIYLNVVNNGYGSSEVYKRLADTYYFNAEYIEAAKWYGELHKLGTIYEPEYIFRYALSLKSIGKYDESDTMMKQFELLSKQDDRGEIFENQTNYLKLIESQSGKFRLQTQLMNDVNSDFAPSFYGDKVIFASNRNLNAKRIHDWNEKPFYDLFTTSRNNDGLLEGANKFNKKINSDFHESTAVFSNDLKTVYFTRNNYTQKNYKTDASGVNRLKMYTSMDKGDGNWSEPVEVPFNSNEYSVAHPALSPDGTKLYFSSDMPGTSGSADLYMVAITGNNTYTTPVNLGNPINTDGRESFPFISEDNMLYFASDGRPGLGGLDIYAIKLGDDGKHVEGIFNIGEPINSAYDDFTFIINDQTKYGFFASNRPAGRGDDDIYGFIQLEPLSRLCAPALTGRLSEKNTNEPIQNATVSLRDTANEVLKQTTTDVNGLYDFGVINCEMEYLIRVVATGYDTVEERFKSPNKTMPVIKDLVMFNNKLGPTDLKPGDDLAKVLNIPMIYFDFDKSNIRPDAEVELQKILAVMQAYPTMIIDIRSHTDSRASNQYNVALSGSRATSTRAYLINKGIEANRLTAAGYGENKLVNECSDGVACSEEAHQLNRRSEFIIRKM